MPPRPADVEAWWLCHGSDALSRLVAKTDTRPGDTRPGVSSFLLEIQRKLRVFDNSPELEHSLLSSMHNIASRRAWVNDFNPRSKLHETIRFIFLAPQDGGINAERALEGLDHLDEMELHRQNLVLAAKQATASGMPELTHHVHLVKELDRHSSIRYQQFHMGIRAEILLLGLAPQNQNKGRDAVGIMARLNALFPAFSILISIEDMDLTPYTTGLRESIRSSVFEHVMSHDGSDENAHEIIRKKLLHWCDIPAYPQAREALMKYSEEAKKLEDTCLEIFSMVERGMAMSATRRSSSMQSSRGDSLEVPGSQSSVEEDDTDAPSHMNATLANASFGSNQSIAVNTMIISETSALNPLLKGMPGREITMARTDDAAFAGDHDASPALSHPRDLSTHFHQHPLARELEMTFQEKVQLGLILPQQIASRDFYPTKHPRLSRASRPFAKTSISEAPSMILPSIPESQKPATQQGIGKLLDRVKSRHDMPQEGELPPSASKLQLGKRNATISASILGLSKRRPSLKLQISCPELQAPNAARIANTYSAPGQVLPPEDGPSFAELSQKRLSASSQENDQARRLSWGIAPPRLSPIEYARLYLLEKARSRREGRPCQLPKYGTKWYWNTQKDACLLLPTIPTGIVRLLEQEHLVSFLQAEVESVSEDGNVESTADDSKVESSAEGVNVESTVEGDMIDPAPEDVTIESLEEGSDSDSDSTITVRQRVAETPCPRLSLHLGATVSLLPFFTDFDEKDQIQQSDQTSVDDNPSSEPLAGIAENVPSAHQPFEGPHDQYPKIVTGKGGDENQSKQNDDVHDPKWIAWRQSGIDESALPEPLNLTKNKRKPVTNIAVELSFPRAVDSRKNLTESQSTILCSDSRRPVAEFEPITVSSPGPAPTFNGDGHLQPTGLPSSQEAKAAIDAHTDRDFIAELQPAPLKVRKQRQKPPEPEVVEKCSRMWQDLADEIAAKVTEFQQTTSFDFIDDQTLLDESANVPQRSSLIKRKRKLHRAASALLLAPRTGTSNPAVTITKCEDPKPFKPQQRKPAGTVRCLADSPTLPKTPGHLSTVDDEPSLEPEDTILEAREGPADAYPAPLNLRPKLTTSPASTVRKSSIPRPAWGTSKKDVTAVEAQVPERTTKASSFALDETKKQDSVTVLATTTAEGDAPANVDEAEARGRTLERTPPEELRSHWDYSPDPEPRRRDKAKAFFTTSTPLALQRLTTTSRLSTAVGPREGPADNEAKPARAPSAFGQIFRKSGRGNKSDADGQMPAVSHEGRRSPLLVSPSPTFRPAQWASLDAELSGGAKREPKNAADVKETPSESLEASGNDSQTHRGASMPGNAASLIKGKLRGHGGAPLIVKRPSAERFPALQSIINEMPPPPPPPSSPPPSLPLPRLPVPPLTPSFRATQGPSRSPYKSRIPLGIHMEVSPEQQQQRQAKKPHDKA
ncbi:hypothetical protein HIM_03686 [Hirsutella minnesotensis 3608]|uniref:Uncharacterized protein n=1 Tax=Hirsutella minnesotensis 3608 TaxID=1043627 RepID=A0A0F8A6B9_9HYPO|nr:hypothetical protein HIM_03686 [Hirsutella minnesotensis 3608]